MMKLYACMSGPILPWFRANVEVAGTPTSFNELQRIMEVEYRQAANQLDIVSKFSELKVIRNDITKFCMEFRRLHSLLSLVPKDNNTLVIQQFIIKLPKTVTGFINTSQQASLKGVIEMVLRISQGMGAGTDTETQSQWRTPWKSNEMRNQESRSTTTPGTPSTPYRTPQRP